MDKMSCLGGGVEDDGTKEQKRQNKLIDQQLKKDKKAYRALHRLLLLGMSLPSLLSFPPPNPINPHPTKYSFLL